MSDFYLVQRLKVRHPEQPEGGFDGFFSLEYMGSAEYEFDTPSRSLKAMRAYTGLAVHEREILHDGVLRTVYFVASDVRLAEKIAAFTAWLNGGVRCKERTHFPEQFTYKANEWEKETAAWWSFDDDIAWSLDRHIADRLLTAFATKRAVKA